VIDPEWLFERFSSLGVDFYAGVPDSVLRWFCDCLDSHANGVRHIVAANEGGAIALACGHHLATGGIGLVYMQNSGLGNAVNPLLSLADRDVYALPMLLLVGWRGKPGENDEPQHVKQGRVTGNLLDAMDIPWFDLGEGEGSAAWALTRVQENLTNSRGPCALLIGNHLLTRGPLGQSIEEPHGVPFSREDAIRLALELLPDAAVLVGTTGMISREVFELRQHGDTNLRNYFMNVGAMGHASQIAAGIAVARPEKTVVCLDGDGSVLMHLGALATTARIAPKNFLHLVFNNQAHDSVGGQATANPGSRLAAIAKEAGYAWAERVDEAGALRCALANWRRYCGPAMIEVMVRKGARKELGRPGNDLLGFKNEFMGFLHGS
jgi:phosphonopyruvate decarboxylase